MDNFEKINELLGERLQCGGLTCQPYGVTQSGTLRPDRVIANVNQESRTACLKLQYGDVIKDTILLSWQGSDVVWTRTIKNTSNTPVTLVELGIQLDGISFGQPWKDDYFYHPENPRIYDKLTIPVHMKRTANMVEDSGFDAVAGNRWADPGVVSDRVGASPYQPFPAVLLSNYKTDKGIIHGTLAQDVFFHNHLFSHESEKVRWDMLSSLKGVDHIDLRPGHKLVDRWYMGATDRADQFEYLFDSYKKALKTHLPPLFGSADINRHALVWGSWNDGIFRDMDQERLFKMAEFIRKELPTVEWIQIDDGYSAKASELKQAHGLGAPYEENGGVDLEKFPDGLEAFSDGIRERGMKPAIWIGGVVPNQAPLAQEHPDWFVDYSYRMDRACVLDVSKPEVREYMVKALDFYLVECGFEGVKQDFWSYVFEDSHDLLEKKNKAGYQWREWWLHEIRKRLPDYGHFQTGCDIVMGNPFLAKYFTNYRYVLRLTMTGQNRSWKSQSS